MTGFGLSSFSLEELTVSIEVKSLNSKFLDTGIRLPKVYSEKEAEVRNLVAEKLERGKISVTVDYVKTGKQAVTQKYNETLFMAYYAELKRLADRAMAPYENLFQIALNSPDVIQPNGKETLDPREWEKVVAAILKAIEECDAFRTLEGKVLAEKIATYIESIRTALLEVERLDPKRIEKIRSRITGRVKDFFGDEGFDLNRLEQEIIFYIEKLDIHEERVRLKTHLDHFEEALKSHQSNGKKLGFIAQEIGREINTIGSKANDAEIQKHVILMKEELEKIKEQLGNVL